jgi:hypothetical protein
MSTLKLSEQAWNKILRELHTRHPPSVFAIRNRMKLKLGFTNRSHWELQDNNGNLLPMNSETLAYGNRVHQVHLDFYNENKRTLFELEYSELITLKDIGFAPVW